MPIGEGETCRFPKDNGIQIIRLTIETIGFLEDMTTAFILPNSFPAIHPFLILARQGKDRLKRSQLFEQVYCIGGRKTGMTFLSKHFQ